MQALRSSIYGSKAPRPDSAARRRNGVHVPQPHGRGSPSQGAVQEISSRRCSRRGGRVVPISIDCPNHCSISAFLKSSPRLSLIQFSAVSRGNWSCHFAIFGSQAEHSRGVSRNVPTKSCTDSRSPHNHSYCTGRTSSQVYLVGQ